MTGSNRTPRKPRALAAGSRLGVFAPASPAESVEMIAGLAELKRHGFQIVANQDSKAEGYFAGPSLERTSSEMQVRVFRDARLRWRKKRDGAWAD